MKNTGSQGVFFHQIKEQTIHDIYKRWKNMCFDKLTIEEGLTVTVKAFVHDHDDSTSKDEVET